MLAAAARERPASRGVHLAVVDCTINPGVCSAKHQNIQWYPTIKYYSGGEFKATYQNSQPLEANALLEWLKQQLPAGEQYALPLVPLSSASAASSAASAAASASSYVSHVLCDRCHVLLLKCISFTYLCTCRDIRPTFFIDSSQRRGRGRP
jgi:hypothetical protein